MIRSKSWEISNIPYNPCMVYGVFTYIRLFLKVKCSQIYYIWMVWVWVIFHHSLRPKVSSGFFRSHSKKLQGHQCIISLLLCQFPLLTNEIIGLPGHSSHETTFWSLNAGGHLTFGKITPPSLGRKELPGKHDFIQKLRSIFQFLKVYMFCFMCSYFIIFVKTCQKCSQWQCTVIQHISDIRTFFQVGTSRQTITQSLDLL